jgi:hypothetical protein
MNEENVLVRYSANGLQTSFSSLMRRGLSLIERPERKIVILDSNEARRIYRYLTRYQYVTRGLRKEYSIRIFECRNAKDAVAVLEREKNVDLLISNLLWPDVFFFSPGREDHQLFKKTTPSLKVILLSEFGYAPLAGYIVEDKIADDLTHFKNESEEECYCGALIQSLENRNDMDSVISDMVRYAEINDLTMYGGMRCCYRWYVGDW